MQGVASNADVHKEQPVLSLPVLAGLDYMKTLLFLLTETWVSGSSAECHEQAYSSNEKKSVTLSAPNYSEFDFSFGFVLVFLELSYLLPLLPTKLFFC